MRTGSSTFLYSSDITIRRISRRCIPIPKLPSKPIYIDTCEMCVSWAVLRFSSCRFQGATTKMGSLLWIRCASTQAATREVAAEDHVPPIDLYQLSRSLLEPMTQQQADQYNATAHKDAEKSAATPTTPDRTHLNDFGKRTFGDMVAQAASQNIPGLRPYITLTSHAGK
jgi:hypothetical protein